MATTPFFKTDCPGCGAPVEAHSATSVTLVCGYCNSLLVWQDEGLIDSGRDSALLEDFSPLQIGTGGQFAMRSFTLVGRLQVRYERGMWNEWYALFDDGSTGWLSEAGDLYVMTKQAVAPADLPDFADIRAGRSSLTYESQVFMASDVREITLSRAAAQGELPFALPENMTNRVADWRCESAFLTLDYAVALPQAFVGRMVKLSDLSLTNTRSEDDIRARAGRLKGTRHAESCPQCGSSVEWLSGLTPCVVCPSCGSSLDVGEDKAVLLEADRMRKAQKDLFALPLGASGRLQERAYTVIGAVYIEELSGTATEETIRGSQRLLLPNGWWVEYLLYNPLHGFAWLVHTNDGIWEFSETLVQWPRLNADGVPQRGVSLVQYGGRVAVAAGAFYWHIRSGDLTHYTDYLVDGKKICCKLSANELAWSEGKRISYAEVAKAFGLPDGGDGGAVPMKEEINPQLRRMMLALFAVINLPMWFAMQYGEQWVTSFLMTAFAVWMIWAPDVKKSEYLVRAVMAVLIFSFINFMIADNDSDGTAGGGYGGSSWVGSAGGHK